MPRDDERAGTMAEATGPGLASGIRTDAHVREAPSLTAALCRRRVPFRRITRQHFVHDRCDRKETGPQWVCTRVVDGWERIPAP